MVSVMLPVLDDPKCRNTKSNGQKRGRDAQKKCWHHRIFRG